MSTLDTRELAGGLFLIATGGLFSGYALAKYSIGTVTKMGPGMVPVALGALLVVFGIVVAVGALTKGRNTSEIRVAVPLIILGSVLVFGLLIAPFGLFPAIIGCVLVATLAEGKVRPRFSLVLAGVLCVLAWLVFVVALQLAVPLIDWPF
ncbi:tripartite tricarboxylate transporter TctB family protein [Frigidibacter albus]|uniref:Tripartite tricarboxylate transporter TctB family protein n=1 Tax=Frigidibacter albus TaxID=1465486 RepID=A0A6L8VB15_9RHOB|nr:tripartite tricarboxylate transporter TctB family protein [Frigidibacter albus]MZQ87517.1 tripartite tricarboxylate transporter TctB family protein [Frigidibacter albus]NBE29423.1 tripartite tricarboxylate transporter TctB family protein [Frigidibacter albus]GGH45008.1 hypothetical protein GCM10011341_04680 [Frigidibacter albus]